MKKIAFFSLFFVMAFYAGCSTVKFSPTQSITQTCPANLNSNSESKEKQCCLKDTLNITVKPVVETCKPDNVKDNSGASTNIEVKPKVKYAPKKSLDINGKVKVQNQEVNDFGTGCFGQNCEINNIYIESKDEAKNNLKDGDIEKNYLEKIRFILQNEHDQNYHILIILSLIISIFFFYILNLWPFPAKPNNKKNSTGTTPFLHLGPIDNIQISSETEKLLEYAINENNKDIKNIAITGLYGSGKSSLWKTFHREKEKIISKKIIEISLINFSTSNKKHPYTKKTTETTLEKSIIQQLVYSQSGIELKHKESTKQFLLTTLFSSIIFIFLALSIPLINDTLFSILKLELEKCTYTNFIYIFFFLLILYSIIFLLIKKTSNCFISKICLMDIEISLESKKSPFKEYLNEIVDFFEKTKCNCVIIEDLDRFNFIEIFTKLRELNIQINNNSAIKDTVKFIYFVKDDILSKYERTKFFDIIIPVIPQLSVNNAANIVKRTLTNLNKKRDLTINLSDAYLLSIQDYLEDFRLTKSVINESFIYKSEILSYYQKIEEKSNHKIKLSDEKIFSLILYKNLYPRDFAQLQKGEGILYSCLNIFEYTPNSTTVSQ